MNTKRDEIFETHRADMRDWKNALEMLWHDLDPPIRRAQIMSALVTARKDPGTLEGLFVGQIKGAIVGAILATVQCGNYAVLTKPSFVAPNFTDIFRQACCQLINVCSAWAFEKGATLLQCMLEPVSLDSKACFEACGYSAYTHIEYLAINIGHSHLPTSPELNLETVDPLSQRQRWTNILEETYKETMDCPFLAGRRDLGNVIDGYINTGDFDPDNWLIATNNGLDVGCLIVTEHKNVNQTELVYFGIAQQERGKGTGKRIVESAMVMAARHGSERLILAVDRNNKPAQDIYRHLGFSKWESRIAMLRFDSPANKCADFT